MLHCGITFKIVADNFYSSDSVQFAHVMNRVHRFSLKVVVRCPILVALLKDSKTAV